MVMVIYLLIQNLKKIYCIPLTPRDFAIVMDAIPSGAIALLKNSVDSVPSVI